MLNMRHRNGFWGPCMRRALGALLVIVLIVSPAAALADALPGPEPANKAATPEKYFQYTVDYGGAIITEYEGPKSIKHVVVPAKLDGYTVLGIEYGGFANQRHIKSVRLPEGIEFIDGSAFANCTSLTSINLPSSITDIGSLAFSECTKLPSIVIPEKVTVIEHRTFYNCSSLKKLTIKGEIGHIGALAFYNCALPKFTLQASVGIVHGDAFARNKKLKRIDVAAGNTEYSSDNGILYDKNKTELIKWPEGSEITKYTLPSSVVDIGEGAVAGVKNLKTLSMGDHVLRIGAEAFSGSAKLKSVTLSGGVRVIEESTFAGCKSLQKIEIPEGVTTLGESVFYKCPANIKVYLPKSLVNLPNDASGGYTFPKKATLFVYANTPAHQYAIDKKFKFVLR